MSSNGATETKAEMVNEKDSKSSFSKDEKPKVDLGGHVDLGADEELQHNLGRLVVDPEEAKIEFGEERAAKLKKTPDGKWILWPQPFVSFPDPVSETSLNPQQDGGSR